MRDSDPRPMPPEVLRAYREPIDRVGLLVSGAYGEYEEEDFLDVIETLTRLLVAKYGEVWIDVDGREMTASAYARRRFETNPTDAIFQLERLEEYGGAAGVEPLLAQAMQPRWSKWWDSFEWKGSRDVVRWGRITKFILGLRQLQWLTAQYARVVIDRIPAGERVFALRAIEAAEAHARMPNDETLRKASSAAEDADNAWDRLYNGRNRGASRVAANAMVVASFAATFVNPERSVDALVYAANAAGGDGGIVYPENLTESLAAAYGRFAEITKRLITPTLIVRASGGLHARTTVAPIVAGLALGAGAMFIAKRA